MAIYEEEHIEVNGFKVHTVRLDYKTYKQLRDDHYEAVSAIRQVYNLVNHTLVEVETGKEVVIGNLLASVYRILQKTMKQSAVRVLNGL